MAHPRFEDLALQYVLADEPSRELAIAEKAATAIEESTNSRIAVGQWVASINRWIQPSDDPGDDNLISRAKALEFLASTLGVLEKRESSLKADQIALLVTFFGSLFSSDHRGGITASAGALRHLVSMKSFQPTSATDIIANVCKLGDDFKLQTPATRLEVYQLFLGLLRDPAVANDLEYRHGSACGFIANVLDLCKNERDPQNLLKWFETLQIFLQSFSPSADVTSEVFKTFSAYFPISLRASATPSGITAEDLKSAVRSCFSAHYRLAGHAIPYLLNKLDQGEAVSVSVKVDILQTLDACLVQYEHPQQSVVPFVNQIWGSLKYEVRNGEVTDTIKATLKVIGSLTKRLDDAELLSFLSNAWGDLVEDISNATYTAQAGRLLIAIAGASARSFAALTPKVLSHIKATVKQTQSTSHKRDLITLLNSILIVRSHLIDNLENDASSERELAPLKDELFGDTLFFEFYLPMWEESSDGRAATERVGALKKVMEGLAVLVGQRSSVPDSSHQLCSVATCEKIFSWLAGPSVIRPLQGNRSVGSVANNDTAQDIRDAAVAALRDAVPLYPPAFQLLLQQYLLSIKAAYQEQVAAHDLPLEIKLVAVALCEIGCSNTPDPNRAVALSNPISLISVLLKGLLWMLSEKAPPRYWTAFICSIHYSVLQLLSPRSSKHPSSQHTNSQHLITKEWLIQCTKQLEEAGSPQPDLDSAVNPNLTVKTPGNLDTGGIGVYQQLLAYSFLVVRQLYRRFTTVHSQADGLNDGQPRVGLSQDFEQGRDLVIEQDICLHQLGLLAASVVRALSQEEQKALGLGTDMFTLFHNSDLDGIYTQGELIPAIFNVSSLDNFRTAPLSMGILQGLYPGVMDSQHHIAALNNLCAVLTSTPAPYSDTTRAALDIILTTLSNKLRTRDGEHGEKYLQLQYDLIDTLTTTWDMPSVPGQDFSTTIRVFRSVLHFLAGDVARFQSSPSNRNPLLKMICDRAPSQPVIGRQLARSFEVLASPKECLDKENHAIRKPLSGEWLYFTAVRPYLKDCFPSPGGGGDIDAAVATNRTAATFAILKHLTYEQYASDVGEVVRVAIRALSTSERDGDAAAETAACLGVLLRVLEHEPAALREHLAGLITGAATAYERAVAGEVAAGARDRILCRKFALEFLCRLPPSYAAQHLVPHRRQLLRPLSVACGDPVREIRRVALAARRAWEGLG
ncbi:Dos2-interacting transcription regulator of RNA-Pol-II-domain-containing protein [Durotheca rogersii]|uniref:Dos2-interacting transcription regulator of RNA-Pol-II-domain-containing protein n=1 Tax=Durotheca rogersii TaxID=419775 RepID=UPI002220BBF3|nr:Dos2-interacting transcription regulator of RNA-Pol-II-domain-containing protein [Durotheca rogersii]KAI5862658.1 Dos2-interacting transcription regulator of RNA-Pol-II-domain-containing protein [Durotheca rogersii]